jgi:uncharacterized cupin superfamily protein
MTAQGYKASMERPPFIRNYRELETKDDSQYPGSRERLSIGAPLGRGLGLSRLGIHHETLPPGRRTSWPHAESTEEEFVYVLEGKPEVWIDGHLHSLQPGDAVAFVPGTGISHTVINNTDQPVRLLVVGERRDDDKVYYPKHPGRKAQIGDRWWSDRPEQPLGPHDGMPDALRKHPVDDA